MVKEQINKWIEDALKKISNSYSDKDIIVLIYNFNETLEHNYNFYSRIKEFLLVYFPELAFSVKNTKKIFQILKNSKNRGDLIKYSKYGDRLGMRISKKDEQLFFKFIISLNDKCLMDKEFKAKYLEKFSERLKELLENYAPNLDYLTNYKIAARLIVMRNGLENLSMLTGAKIQVLGAEKALYLHKIKNKSCPKHGIIYNLPDIKNAKKKDRGKISRRIANKIAIATKIDYYSKKLNKEFIIL